MLTWGDWFVLRQPRWAHCGWAPELKPWFCQRHRCVHSSSLARLWMEIVTNTIIYVTICLTVSYFRCFCMRTRSLYPLGTGICVFSCWSNLFISIGWCGWCVVTREHVFNLQAATEQNPLKGSRPAPVSTFTVFYPKLMLCGFLWFPIVYLFQWTCAFLKTRVHRVYDHIVNSLVGHSGGIRAACVCWLEPNSWGKPRQIYPEDIDALLTWTIVFINNHGINVLAYLWEP